MSSKPVMGICSNWLRRHPFLGRCALRSIPDLRWKLRLRPVGDFYIRLRRNRSFWLRDPFTHESFPLGALRRLIRAGDVVYDVGANIGLYARVIASQFGASRVVCFEPMSENRILLEANISASRSQAIIGVLPLALSDRDGCEELQVDDLMSGSAVLDRVSGGQASQGRRQYGLKPVTERVAVARLDKVVIEKNLPIPQVIKIDIEGAEALMLKGATELLQTAKPDLVIELHGPEVARSVFQLLDGLHYHCFGNVECAGGRAYRRLTGNIVGSLQGRYDLHFLVASRDASRLERKIEPCFFQV